jgi:hypothetical protein
MQSAPRRSRRGQRRWQGFGAQDHKADQPPDSLLAVGVGTDQLGDVADWRGLSLDLPALVCRPLAVTLARFVLRAAKGTDLPLPLAHKLTTGLALPFDDMSADAMRPRLVASAMAPSRRAAALGL